MLLLYSQNSTEEQNRVSASQIDSLTTRLLQTEEHLREEKGRTKVLNEKLKQMELEIEAIPILKAQASLDIEAMDFDLYFYTFYFGFVGRSLSVRFQRGACCKREDRRREGRAGEKNSKDGGQFTVSCSIWTFH